MKLKPTHEESEQLARYWTELTRFLWNKNLDGTNNAAVRKTTGGSRSRSGADPWAKLASLLRTTDQRKLGVFEATKRFNTYYWAEIGR